MLKIARSRPTPSHGRDADQAPRWLNAGLRWLDGEHAPTAVILVCVLGLIAYFRGPISPDVAGQFWLADAMRSGSRLYIDFIEVNPPLWFWMALPVDWFAKAIGVRPEPVTIVVVGMLVWLAIRGTRIVLDLTERSPTSIFYSYVAVTLLIVPLQAIEQREHLALIAAIPYIALAAARRQSVAIPLPLALWIGLGGALGFALKPFFLAVPLLLELWLITTLRRGWRPFRTETVVLASAGAAYALAVFWLTPVYLTETVPLMLAVYGGNAPPFAEVVDIMPFMWAAMLTGIAIRWRPVIAGFAPLTVGFLIGFAGFLFSWAIQHAGFLYQGLPATCCIALAVAASVVELGKPTNALRLFLPALMAWPLSFPFAKTEMTMTPALDIAPAFADLKRGDAFGLVSSIGVTTWPSSVGRGLRNSGRHGQFWMLGTFDRRPNDPKVRRVTLNAIAETAFDYRCYPPKVIVFTRFQRTGPLKYTVADPYRLFMRNPDFADVLSHYRLSQRYGIFDVYSPVTPLPPVDRRACRILN